MSILEQLGVVPIVNAAGTLTRLGGTRAAPGVLDAMREASQVYLPMEELQAAASRRLAAVTGAEAGLVTCGASAAMTLGTAACLTGLDIDKMERLPDTSSMPNRVLVAETHRTGYEKAVRIAGAELDVIAGRVESATAFERAFTDSTAAVLYTVECGEPELKAVCDVAHAHGVPVLVDAAAELPPPGNLRSFVETGADLVAFSGGKMLCGPQNSGLLVGRRTLIASAALQSLDMHVDSELWRPPSDFIDVEALQRIPTHGIGRGMKVAKETVAGLMAALAMFEGADHDREAERLQDSVREIGERLDGLSSWCVERTVATGTRPEVPMVEMRWVGPGDAAAQAKQTIRNLRKGSPPIHVDERRWREGVIGLNPLCLNRQETSLLCSRIQELTPQL